MHPAYDTSGRWLVSRPTGPAALRDILPPWRHSANDGQRLAYTVYGRGLENDRADARLLLLSQKMQEPWRKELAARGNRVITFDPLGHGESDRPRDMWRYSMTENVAHSGRWRFSTGSRWSKRSWAGTSMGANTMLRIRRRWVAGTAAGDRSSRCRCSTMRSPRCAMAFTPLLLWLTFGEYVRQAVSPTRLAASRGGVLRSCSTCGSMPSPRSPGPSAAVLQGIIFGRTAPHRVERRTFDAPALAHRPPARTGLHPFSDADMLAHELPNSRLIRCN